LRRCRSLRRAGLWRRARLHALDRLLIRRLKDPSRLRLGAKRLDDLGDVLGLVHCGVAEVSRPVEIRAHFLYDIWKARERFHSRIPILLVDPGIIVVGDEGLVLVQPALRLDDLDWVCARRQELGEQRVRIERDRGEQLLEFLARERAVFRWLFRLSWGWRRGWSLRWRRIVLSLGKKRVCGQGCGDRQSE
jgi:hypothetical protein